MKAKKERTTREKLMISIVFIVVLLIPIIYSFFYLKSYWDPYGDLTGINIAFVNMDKGNEGENQGNEFLKAIEDSGTFNIDNVTLSEANEGMQNGNYYAMILVPENFTECLNSASTNDKQIATVTYSPNQATNYLATQIINSAMKTIETSLEEKIDSKIVGTLADNLNEVPNSIEKISDGAGEILDGSDSLNSGIEKINTGTTTLNTKYSEFNEGVNTAYNGSTKLQDGINQVASGTSELSTGTSTLNSSMTQINEGVNELSEKANDGISKLSTGVTELNTGATSLSTGVTEYTTGAEMLATGSKAYVAGVDSYNGAVEEYLNAVIAASKTSTDPSLLALATKAQLMLDDINIKTLINSGSNITSGADKLLAVDSATGYTKGKLLQAGANTLQIGIGQLATQSASFTDLTDGIDNLKMALSKVKEGTESLQTGFGKLQVGTNTLQTGSGDLTSGLNTLSTSSQVVKDSINTLNEGTTTALSGSEDLSSGVRLFKNEIDEGLTQTKASVEKLGGIEEFAEDSVDFETEAYGKVDSYGVAFTPLFLSIGLWVGALMCYVVLYYDQKNRFRIFGSARKDKIIQNITYIAVGAIEGIITAILLKTGLGFEVQNIHLYYFASALTGITFMSIIQCLIRNFDDVGKFLALIILVLQLAASGGTFPIETINPAFRAISNYLPMTYTIKLFREILVPTMTNFKSLYIWILIGISVTCFAITTIVDAIKNKRNSKNEEVIK